MPRPTLDEIFAEPDEFGLLDVKPARTASASAEPKLLVLREVSSFFERHGRLPDIDSPNHSEMRLAAHWDAVRRHPTQDMATEDNYGLLTVESAPKPTTKDWRDEPAAGTYQLPWTISSMTMGSRSMRQPMS